MTKAFYSFHFTKDVVRASQVRNIGAVEGSQIVDDNSWEQLKKKGDADIRDWINTQMSDCDVVIVLVGTDTSTRPWIDYEIRHAWDSKKPIFGIRIHKLKDFSGETCAAGLNPFANVKLKNGKFLSELVPLHNPEGLTSQDVYATIAKDIKGWIRCAPSLS
jgi:hypothetical protein